MANYYVKALLIHADKTMVQPADLVSGNLGHAVIVAGGWCRISSNFCTPSHMLKVLSPRGYKQELVMEQRHVSHKGRGAS